DVGAEVGGYIIKEKLWFHVGYNPSRTRNTRTRSIARLVDTDGDLNADIDPETGFTARETVGSREWKEFETTHYFTTKISGAITEDHQFQISAFGNPTAARRTFAVTRNSDFSRYNVDEGAIDVAAKWSSKFNDGATQVDAIVG